MTVWKEKDPIGTVAKQTGLTRLQVLEQTKAALLNRWAHELKRNPKAPKAMANLDAMIKAERENNKTHANG